MCVFLFIIIIIKFENKNRPADDEFEIIASPGHGILSLFVTQLENVRRVDADQSISNSESSLFSQTSAIHLKQENMSLLKNWIIHLNKHIPPKKSECSNCCVSHIDYISTGTSLLKSESLFVVSIIILFCCYYSIRS